MLGIIHQAWLECEFLESAATLHVYGPVTAGFAILENEPGGCKTLRLLSVWKIPAGAGRACISVQISSR